MAFHSLLQTDCSIYQNYLFGGFDSAHDFIFGTWEARQQYFSHLNIELLPNSEVKDKIKVLSAKRNVFVHNRGLVNLKFLHHVQGTGFVAQLNDRLTCTIDDFLETFNLVAEVVEAIDSELESRFAVTQSTTHC